MERPEPQSHQENTAQTLRFLAAYARRTGRDLAELAASLGLALSDEQPPTQPPTDHPSAQGDDPPPAPAITTPSRRAATEPAGRLLDALARGRPGDAVQRFVEKILTRQDAAAELRAYLTDHPEGTTVRLLGLLYRLALDVARERYGAHARKLAQVAFAVPIELLAEHLGVNRSTVWRALKRVEASELVAARDWYTTSTAGPDGAKVTRVAAKLFAVRLKPGRARLRHDELTHSWRDLDGDRARGRTAWAWKLHHLRPNYAVLRSWALGQPVAPDEVPPDVQLYDVHGLAGLLPHEATPLVTQLADYLARRLSDTHSRAFYAKLLWKVVHLELRPEALITQIERVEADLREGWAKKPGALLAYRLSSP